MYDGTCNTQYIICFRIRFWMNVNHEKSLFDVCGNPEHYTFYIVKVDPILTAFSCSFNGCFWMNVEWHDQGVDLLPLLSIYTWCSQCRGWIVTVWNGTLHLGLCTEGNILNIPARWRYVSLGCKNEVHYYYNIQLHWQASLARGAHPWPWCCKCLTWLCWGYVTWALSHSCQSLINCPVMDALKDFNTVWSSSKAEDRDN